MEKCQEVDNMVKVEINVEEIRALDELMKDAKCPIPMGLKLGLFRIRVQEAFNKDQESKLKEKFNDKGKGKTK